VLVSANLYLEAIAAGARVEAAKAQLETARALHNQALDMKTAGTVAGIDVLRAEVAVSLEQHAPRRRRTPSRRRSCSSRA
jgi:outer membrane protein TolC